MKLLLVVAALLLVLLVVVGVLVDLALAAQPVSQALAGELKGTHGDMLLMLMMMTTTFEPPTNLAFAEETLAWYFNRSNCFHQTVLVVVRSGALV